MNIIENGYKIFQRVQGQIIKVRFSHPKLHGGLTRIGESFFIEVDKNECLELQVVTALHELAHLGEEFDEDTRRLRKYSVDKFSYMDDELPPDVKKNIDEAVIKFYEGDFPLVDVLREYLSSYKSLAENQ